MRRTGTIKPDAPTRLPTQAFVSHNKPEPGKVPPVVMDEVFYKPRGGMWTSSLNDRGGEWLEWLTGEGYSLEEERWGGKLWALEPRDAHVYVIHGPDELLALVERYPHPQAKEWAKRGLDTFRVILDWPKIAEHYDAVWIPNPWSWRFGYADHAVSMFFYVLDAESTCWFRWCFEDEVRELDPNKYLSSG